MSVLEFLGSPYPWRYHLVRYLRQMRNRSQRKSYLYDAVDGNWPRAEYGYGVWHAAVAAKRLGLKKISLIEFGVAGGEGLIRLEEHAARIKERIDIDFEIYGFDTGSGLTKPVDYRDRPFKWVEGQFPMDVDWLRQQLKVAKLVLGDVKQTARTFWDLHQPAPIGWISFDLDLYSSTTDAFQIFEGPSDRHLPRIPLYFDDVVGSNEYVGELAAINEFNTSNSRRKIVHPYGLTQFRSARWAPKIFEFHDFDHAHYNDSLRAFSNDDADGMF